MVPIVLHPPGVCALGEGRGGGAGVRDGADRGGALGVADTVKARIFQTTRLLVLVWTLPPFPRTVQLPPLCPDFHSCHSVYKVRIF